MANSRSAEKRVRQIKARTAHNRSLKSRIRTFRKRVQAAVDGGDKQAAAEELANYFSALDKAAKRNVIHKNASARLKSSAARAVATLSS